MNVWVTKQKGFTIVELLIVIVVIAILAAITIVAYNGIRDRAAKSQVQTTLAQANKKVLAYAALNGDTFPSTLEIAGVGNTGPVALEYSADNSSTPKRYAITASNGVAGTYRYYISSTSTQASEGTAPGHNLIPWDKTQDSTAPISLASGVTYDTTVFREGGKSVRVAPGLTGKGIRGTPYAGTPGQQITVRLSVLTDPNWNGGSNNSKIRFGRGANGALLTDCPYNGVKTAWTEVSCSFTFSEANPSVLITVGNDGSAGTIWLDDISVSIR